MPWCERLAGLLRRVGVSVGGPEGSESQAEEAAVSPSMSSIKPCNVRVSLGNSTLTWAMLVTMATVAVVISFFFGRRLRRIDSLESPLS